MGGGGDLWVGLAIAGGVCCVVAAVFVPVIAIGAASGLARWREQSALAARLGLVATGAWFTGTVDGRSVAYGVVMVGSRRSSQRRIGHEHDRRLRFVAPVGVGGGSVYVPAGATPSVDEPGAPARDVLVAAATARGVGFEARRPGQGDSAMFPPARWLGDAAGVVWFDHPLHDDSPELVETELAALAALARRVDGGAP